MNRKLEGKVVAITGGNSGLGLASAKEFAKHGAKVSFLVRNQKKADKVLSETGNGAVAFIGDVTDLDSIKNFYEETVKALGKIDVVFANAGITGDSSLETVDEAAFDRVTDVNFKGAFFTIKYAIPHLEKGASLILTSSSLNAMGMAGVSVYSATKAAVRSLARSFTPELRKYDARINVLSPGPIDNEFLTNSGFLSEEEDKAMRNSLAKPLAAGRMGTNEEMAPVALFLASDDSSYMFGAEIQADGGMNQTRWVN